MAEQTPTLPIDSTPPVTPAVTPPVAPVTPPPAAETELIPLHELSRADLAKAKETQDFPRREKQPKAEKPPKAAKPAEPAPVAGDEPPVETPPKARTAKERAAELKADNDALEAELRRRDDLERGRRRPESVPREPKAAPTAEERKAARAAEWKKLREHPDAPQVAEFEHIEDYTAAMADFVSDQKLAARDARQQVAAEKRAQFDNFMGVAQRSVGAFNTYFETHPDEVAKVDKRLMAIVPYAAMTDDDGPATMDNYLAEQLARSGVPAQLAVYFSSHEGKQHWRQLKKLPLPQIHEEFGALAYHFKSNTGGSTPADPPTREVSSAPEPPKHVVSRSTGPIDPMQAAVGVGDVRAFREAMLAEDLARSGR